MKKILILGQSPLPTDKNGVRSAAGLRSHQFLKPLLKRKGFDVTLVTLNPKPKFQASDLGIPVHTLWKNEPKLFKKLQKIHDTVNPDILLGINTFPSFVLSQLKTSAPFWADLNGWILAEAQAQAFKLESDDYWPHYWKMQQAILKKADHFSTVSIPQSHALIGELAGAGRLNHLTFNHSFVTPIANATEIFAREEIPEKNPFSKLKDVPKGAFVMLWTGGYNTWVDEETLFEGLSQVMKRQLNAYFVSTGGGIPGLDETTFARFKQKAEASAFKDRFKFLGWVDQADLVFLYTFADVGLNVDRNCIETTMGARNRINEMMKFGLPVVSTAGTEIAEEMEKSGAGLQVASGKARALAAALERLCLDKRKGSKLLKKLSENGKKFTKEWNYEKSIKSFLEWSQNPLPAPDRKHRISFHRTSIRSFLRYTRDQGLKKAFQKLIQKIS